MVIINTTSATIAMSGLMSGKDLVLAPNGKSSHILPNREMLSKLIAKNGDLKIILDSVDELDMLSQLDPRAGAILYKEPVTKK